MLKAAGILRKEVMSLHSYTFGDKSLVLRTQQSSRRKESSRRASRYETYLIMYGHNI